MCEDRCVDRLNPLRPQVPLPGHPQPRAHSVGRWRWTNRWKKALKAFDMASGTHTIVWESEGQFIVCWGFEVEQLQGE